MNILVCTVYVLRSCHIIISVISVVITLRRFIYLKEHGRSGLKRL